MRAVVILVGGVQGLKRLYVAPARGARLVQASESFDLCSFLRFCGQQACKKFASPKICLLAYVKTLANTQQSRNTLCEPR